MSESINTTYFGVRRILEILNEDLLHDSNQPMSEVVLPLTRIVRKLEEEMQDLQAATKTLVERYADEEELTGELIEEIQEDPDFQQEYADLLNTEVSVDAEKIDSSALVGVSAATILGLRPVLED